MGGRGSGGGSRLSDAERKKRGTFRADRTDERRDAVAVSKVVKGPWLSEIPPSGLPLNAVGTKKYNQLTQMLFDQNKLTSVTQMYAEQAAVLFQEMHRRAEKGSGIPASLSDKMQRALNALKIAEDAPQIANPEGKRNKFASCGFAHRLRQAR